MPLVRHSRVALSLALGICGLGACHSISAGPRTAPGAPASAVSDRMMFGRVITSGGVVTEADWATFVNDVISPRLPDGFIVSRAHGQWRDASGAIARDSGFTLEVIHPPGQPADSVFAQIAAEYCRRFRQESVLRVRAQTQQWLYSVGAR
jgi:hypothetical protein